MAMISAATMLRQYDLRSITSVIIGAAALTKETLAQLTQLLPDCNFVQGYGLTEATCVIAVTGDDDIIFGSCGYLLPGIQARLVDANGQEVERYDSPGELQVHGPNITTGYFKNDEAMREMLTQDGWLRTGDLVEMRKSDKGNTHIFIVDRIKELIKVNVRKHHSTLNFIHQN
jgi:long-subunit acyl-CoA synthetase (AMP-forming)